MPKPSRALHESEERYRRRVENWDRLSAKPRPAAPGIPMGDRTPMSEEAKKDPVEILLQKAVDADDSGDAMRFAQAACNAANAQCAVKTAAKM